MDGEKAVVVVWADASASMTPAHLADFFKVCGPLAAIACSPREPKAGICFKETGARKMALMLDRGIVGYVPVRVHAFSAQQHPDLGLALQTALADPGYRLPTPSSSPTSSPPLPAAVVPSTSASAQSLRPASVPSLPSAESRQSPTPAPGPSSPPQLAPAASADRDPARRSPRSPRSELSIRDLSEEDRKSCVVISNLSAHCTPDLLHEFFILCGHINDVVIYSVRGEETSPTSQAVVLFETESAANMALSLSGAVVAGSVVKVARISSALADTLAQDYSVSGAARWARGGTRSRSGSALHSPRHQPPISQLELPQQSHKSKQAAVDSDGDNDDDDDDVEDEEEREIDDLSPRGHTGLRPPREAPNVQFDVERGMLLHQNRGALFNLRDLATAYVSPDRFLRKGRIYRSAAWARYSLLKAEDFRAASEYVRNVLGIKTIIDLRSGEEKSMDPWYPELGIFYKTPQTPDTPRTATTLHERRRLPVDLVSRSLKVQLFATSSTGIKWKMLKSAFSSSSSTSPPSVSSDRARRRSPDGKSKLFLGLNFYDLQNFQIPGTKRNININVDAAAQMFLTEVITPMGLEGFTKLFVMYAKDEIGCALRICSDPRNYPILIHCTSGKDRTGLIVALVMTVCGVDRTEVVENYHLSEVFLEPIGNEIREENGKKGLGESFDGTPRPLIRNILEFIDAKWGSVPDYLHNACNFTYDEQLRLRKNLLRHRILDQLTTSTRTPPVASKHSTQQQPSPYAASVTSSRAYGAPPQLYQPSRPAPPVPPSPLPAGHYTPLQPISMGHPHAADASRAVPQDHVWPSPLPPVPPRPWVSTGDLLSHQGQPPPPLPARPHAALLQQSQSQSLTALAPASAVAGDRLHDHHQPPSSTSADTSSSPPPPPLPARLHQQSPPPQAAEARSAKDTEAPTKNENDDDEAKTELKDTKEEVQEDEDEKGKETEKEAEEVELSEEERARAVRVTGLPPFMATADLAHFFVFSGRIERLRHDRTEGSATVLYASKSAILTALQLDHALVGGRSVRVLPLPASTTDTTTASTSSSSTSSS